MTQNLGWPELLVVVRHGETERNLRKGYSLVFPDETAREPVRGIADHRMPLAEEGHRAARLAGVRLHDHLGRFDTAWHSGFERTRQTLEELLEACPEAERSAVEVRSSWLVREKESGYMYEMTQGEVDAAFPWFGDYMSTAGSFFLRPVGGENMAQVADRVHLFLQLLREQCAGRRVLVVTHGDVVRAFRFVLEEWGYDETMEWWPANCSAVVYRADPEKGRLTWRECLAPEESEHRM